MNSAEILGIAVVVFAGLWIGAGGWPIKLMRHYKYEQIGFVAMLMGLIICPWTVTLVFCPHAVEAYRSIDPAVLIKSNLFSLAWGVANVLALMCYLRIGFSLTGGILVGVAIPIGVITPMVLKGSGLFSNAPSLFSAPGLTVVAGAAVMIVAVVLAVFSGLGRDRVLSKTGTASRQFGVGLAMAVVAGVLSVGNSFSFVYSQGPIVAAMKAHGAGDISANFAVWAIGLFAGGIVNVLVPAWMMTKKRTWGTLAAYPFELMLCLVGGIQSTVSFAVMGKGMLLLGALGASVGFGVSQAMQMIGGQVIGFAFGEWRNVFGKPRRQIYCAIAVLIFAVVIMAAGNSQAGTSSLVKPSKPEPPTQGP